MGNTKPSQKMLDAAERIRRYDNLIRKQTGVAVKPLRFDGYFNLLNKYGTQKDTTENYQYATEPPVADEMLSSIYEGNGLFARIIDAPAEEAMKAGFELDGIKDTNLIEFYEAALDDLDWEETCITAIKWARLFGGSIAVMLINDGKGIDEPLDWKNIRSIDGIRVYDRSVVQPDYNSMFSYSPEDPFRARGNMIGTPEFYNINSKYGSFTVHESRCLVFKNGVLPENCSNSIYEMWGMPEYIRIKRAMRDCELAHGNGPKMLERAIQAVYKVRGLSELLQTDAGEDIVVKRLQTIDLARGLLNSIAIDSEGEEYDFKTFAFTGVSEIIDTTCNQLSALTSIPQTILFGRSPAGMNATGESDMENWYSFVGRIQKRMIGRNLRYLLSVIFQAGVMTGEIDEIPPISPKFRPLWSLSELEEAQLEQTKAATQQTKAATAQIYVGMQAVDPSEVRKGLSDSGEFNIETLLDDYTDEELFPAEEQVPGETSMPTEAPGKIAEQGCFSEYSEANTAPAENPAASQATENTPVSSEEGNIEESENVDEKADSTAYSVGVIVISGGKVLCGDRQSADGYGLICGPGGHIEIGETVVQAALRETEEEFGIIPNELIPLGLGAYEPDTGLTPILYLCTDYAEGYGSVDREIINTRFLSLEEIEMQSLFLFKPFKDGVKTLLSSLSENTAKKEFISDYSEKPLDKCSECGIVRVEDEQRADVDDDGLQFITVNGAHVPLVEGKAVGGPLKGEDFSESKPVKASGRKTGSKKSKSSKKPSESSQKPEYNGGQGKKEGNSTSPSKKQSQPAPTKPSPYSGNVRATGFINSAELDDHFARHNKSLGCSSKKEYQEKGIDLLTKPCTNGIAGYARADGKVVRFNTKTGEYVSGYPGQNLCTYMIPKDNNGVDLSKALAYYNKHRLEDEKRYGMLKQNK